VFSFKLVARIYVNTLKVLKLAVLGCSDELGGKLMSCLKIFWKTDQVCKF